MKIKVTVVQLAHLVGLHLATFDALIQSTVFRVPLRYVNNHVVKYPCAKDKRDDCRYYKHYPNATFH